MKPLIQIINTDNEPNIIEQIMGHTQDMTPEQRLKWDCENYTETMPFVVKKCRCGKTKV